MNYRLLSICCLFFLFSIATLLAQKDINSYKYIIVPNQYEFQKSEDQHQINSLVKFLFEKDGFKVMSTSSPFPEELAKSPCMGLKAIVKNKSGMLTTKVKIDLVDCYNAVVFSSEEGKSKIKDYKKGYQEAVRKAFVAIDSLHYKYDASLKIGANKVIDNNESEVKEDANTKVVPAATVAVTSEPSKVVKEGVTANTVVVEEEAATTKKPVEVVVVPVEKEKKAIYEIEGNYLIDIWGECVISKKGNGYSIIGGDENYEFATVSKTSKSNIFMVKKTGFSQSQLLELTEDGNLQIDTENGVKVFKRVK